MTPVGRAYLGSGSYRDGLTGIFIESFLVPIAIGRLSKNTIFMEIFLVPIATGRAGCAA